MASSVIKTLNNGILLPLLDKADCTHVSVSIWLLLLPITCRSYSRVMYQYVHEVVIVIRAISE